MDLVSASLPETARALGLELYKVRTLMERVSMPAFSASMQGNCWIVTRDSAIDCGPAVLTAWAEYTAPALSEADLPFYKGLRLAAGVASTRHSPVLLTAYSKLRTTVDGISLSRDLGGDENVTREAIEFVCRLRGEPIRRRDRRRSNHPMPLEEFLSGRGVALRGLPASIEDEEFRHSYKRPSDNEVGRAAGMANDEDALLAGIVLLACPTQLGPSCIKHSLAIVERLDVLADGAPLTNTEVAIEAIRERFMVNSTNDSPNTLKNNLDYYNWTKRALDRWCEGLPPKKRRSFSRFLLPPVPLDVAAHVLALVAPTAPADGSDAARELDAPQTDWDETAKKVSEERVAILSKMETRWAAFEPLFLKIKSELRSAQATMAAGDKLALPIPVAHTWPVVRPDGMPGVGRQTALAEIDTVANIWRRCADADPTGIIARERLSLEDRLARWERTGDKYPPRTPGTEYDPEGERQLRVIYHRTMPCEPGGESHECWIFPILRAAALYGREHIPDEMLPAHHEARRRLGLVTSSRVPQGILRFPNDADTFLAAACRRYLCGELTPVVETLHGVAIGRVAVRCELLNGLRIGATAQARDDHGCFTAEKIRGKIVFFMSACMKGDDGDEQRTTVLDPVTLNLFERIRLLWLEQWNDGVDDLLPAFAYCNADKKDVPSAGFLLSVEDRALTITELNTLIAVVLGDIIDTTSHPLKYGFAAMIKEAGATPQQLNVACHHDIGSEVSEAYARYGKDLGIEELLAEAHDVLDQDQHIYRLMELQ